MALFWISATTAASPTAAFDALEITEAGTGLCLVHAINMWQTTDLGDAQEEVLRTEFARGNTTSGSGGQTTVIAPLNSFDAAATFAAEIMNTTQATTTTPLLMGGRGWNIRIPQEVLFPPGEYPILRNGERGCWRVSAPADAITANIAALVEQL